MHRFRRTASTIFIGMALFLLHPNRTTAAVLQTRPNGRSEDPTTTETTTETTTDLPPSPHTISDQFNLTDGPLSTSPIICAAYSPLQHNTSVSNCRPLLNQIKTFPAWQRNQRFWIAPPGSFQPRSSPNIPEYGYPPYLFTHDGADCAITVGCSGFDHTSYFSFRDVRAAATDILTECDGEGEKQGGWKRVGIPGTPDRESKWEVTVGTRVTREAKEGVVVE